MFSLLALKHRIFWPQIPNSSSKIIWFANVWSNISKNPSNCSNEQVFVWNVNLGLSWNRTFGPKWKGASKSNGEWNRTICTETFTLFNGDSGWILDWTQAFLFLWSLAVVAFRSDDEFDVKRNHVTKFSGYLETVNLSKQLSQILIEKRTFVFMSDQIALRTSWRFLERMYGQGLLRLWSICSPWKDRSCIARCNVRTLSYSYCPCLHAASSW